MITEQINVEDLPENLQQLLTNIQHHNTPITVNQAGKPMVIIYPANTQTQHPGFGAMKGTGEIIGDLISPAVSEHTWEVLQ
jgi:hypothetical protein